MTDDVLRMRAAVIDEFSAPLRKLRNELGSVRAPREVAKIRDDMKSLHQEVMRVAGSVGSGFGGAMSGLGLGSLAGAAGIAGATAAIRNFSKSAAEAGHVAREVGMSATRLQSIELLGGKIGASADEMRGGVQRFRENLFELKNRAGQMREELLKSGPGGRQLAEEMFNAKSVEDAYGKFLGFLSRVKDPEQARRLAELVTGLGKLGRVSEMGSDKLAKAIEEITKNAGDFDDAARKAKEFEDELSKIETVLTRLRNESMTPFLSGAVKGFEEIREALKGVDWEAWRKGATTAFGEIKSFATDLAGMLKEIRSLMNNDWSPVVGKEFYKNHPGVAKGLFGTPGAGTEADAAMRSGRLAQQAELQRRLEDARKRGDQASTIALERKLEIIAEEIKKLNQKAEGTPSGGGFEKMSFGGGAGGFGSNGFQFASYGGGGIRERMAAFGAGVRESVGMGGGAATARGSLAGNQLEAYKAARAEGLSDSAARALVANMSGEALHKPNDYHWDRKHMASGIVQWDPSRSAAIQRQFGKMPHQMSVGDQTRAALWEMRTNPRFARTWGALNNPNATPEQMMGALVENYENPRDKAGAIANRMRYLRGFNPNAPALAGDTSGMTIKPGAGSGHEALMSLGKMLQASGMVKRFTAFKDEFHKSRPGSLHNRGLAGDFSLNDPSMSGQAAEMIRKTMRSAGLDDSQFQVLDEYRNPSAGATGAHIHYGFRSREAAAQFQRYFAQRQELARAAREAREKPAPVEGAARVDINLNGFPRGTKTEADATGLFRDVKIKRGRLMASGGVGV